MNGAGGTFVLANGVTVELVRTGPAFRSAGSVGHEWPCLGCGERRPVRDARTVVVRELGEPPMRRHILLCRPCLDEVGGVRVDAGAEDAQPV